MIDQLEKKIEDILNNMRISKAIIIDDKIDDEDNYDVLMEIIYGNYDDENFDIIEELNNLGYDDIEEIKRLATEKLLPNNIIDICKEKFPSRFKTELGNFSSVLIKLLGEDKIKKYKSTNDVHKDEFTIDTILFLDYQLEENPPYSSEELANLLAKNDTGTNDPRCIVFISNSPNFTFEDKTFDMSHPTEKCKYFESLRTRQGEKNYKNSLYDFIPKSHMENNEDIYNSLYEILNNFYSGQLFYKLLSQIDKILSESSKDVLGRFHLLNARSIKEILQNKVDLEGISEPVFFTEWISRHIAKSVGGNEKFIEDIHNTLDKINEIPEPCNELYEDIALNDMIRTEMWDKKVNQRFDPITFGDVFEIDYNGKETRGILLTQSCTLAVRGDGSRSGKIGMLVMENKNKKDSKSPSVFREYTDWNGEKIIFCFDETITFCLDILDLTTLDKNGKAIIRISSEKNVQYPQAYWSKGYKKKIEDVTNNIYKKLIKVPQGISFIQVDQTWIPFKINDEAAESTYEFKIKRLCRLDYQYTLNLFQKAQAWWGRIGLPVNLNIWEGFREIKGSVCINRSKETYMPFLVKDGFNEYEEVRVSIDDLENLILGNCGYSGEYYSKIKTILENDAIVKMNYSSGKRLLSLKKSTNGMEELRKNNIHLNLCEDAYNDIKLEVNIFVVIKYFFNDEDITSDMTKEAHIKEKGDQLEIKCTFLIKNLKEYNNLIADVRLNKKIITNKNGDKYLSFSNKELSNIFDTKITNNNLYITTKDEVAATKEN